MKRFTCPRKRLVIPFYFIAFLVAYFCFSTTAYAGDKAKIKQLTSKIENADETSQARLLIDLASLYGADDPELACLTAEKALKVARSEQQHELEVEALTTLAQWSAHLSSRATNAESHLSLAVTIAQKHRLSVAEAKVWVALANMYDQRYQHDKLDSCLQQAVMISDQVENADLRTSIAIVQGSVQYRNRETDAAVASWTACIDHAMQAQDYGTVCKLYLKLHFAAQRKRDLELAAQNRQKALDIAEEHDLDYWVFKSRFQQELELIDWPRDSARQVELEKVSLLLDSISGTLKSDLAALNYHYLRTKSNKAYGVRTEAIRHGNRYEQLANDLMQYKHVVKANEYLSLLNSDLGQFEKSIEHALKALESAIKIDYRVATNYGVVSAIYRENKEYEQALTYLHRGIAHEKKHLRNGYRVFNRYYVDCSYIYHLKQEYETALLYVDSAITVAVVNENDQMLLDASVLKGTINMYDKQFEAAEKVFLQVLKLYQKLGPSVSIAGRLNVLGFGMELYYDMGRYEEALDYGLQVMELQKDVGSIFRRAAVHETLSLIYRGLGDHEEAFNQLVLQQTFKDSIFKLESDAKIKEMQAKFESEEQALRISLLEQDNELSQLELEAQDAALVQSQTTSWTIGIAAVLMALIAFLLFNRYKLRRQQKELIMSNRQLKLEEENRLTAQQLEMMELRSSFFTNVSHEIRTPLTLIKGPLDVLKNRPDEFKKEWIESMDHNADRLMNLVNQAIRYSQVRDSENAAQLENTNYAEFLQRVMKAFRPLASKRNISLQLNNNVGDTTVAMDREMMETAVVNLLSNAFRYTPDGGAITLHLTKSATNVKLEVSDTGTGISPEHLPHLFDRYYRVDGSKDTGFGVGLSIVKETMEKQGGSVSVKSVLNEGTSFSLLLPIVEKTAETVTQVSSEPVPLPLQPDTASNRPSVLVVEDNVEINQFLVDLLSPRYDVITAHNGREGITQAKLHRPSIIVSDVMMPDTDGYALAETLKSDLETSHIPIIMLTAKATQEAKIEGLEKGADDYLYKPVSPDELLLKIGNQLKQRARFQRLYSESHEAAVEDAPSLSPIDAQFLEKANAVMESNLDQIEFSAQDFCNELALNRTSVHHKLKALTGLSTSAFMRSIRIKHAIKLMKEEALSLQEVASESGFTSRHTFNRAFKDHTGSTPSDYRKNLHPKA